MSSQNLIRQTKNAFEYIQKLYLESSYLIKEMEGLLKEEEENFIIGRPSGYGITARSSTGLEQDNVLLWLLRKFAVFFVPEELTETIGGQTITELHDDLKIIYIRIIFDNKNIEQPKIYSGILTDLEGKRPGMDKFEKFMGHIEYNEKKIFSDINNIDYEDVNISMKGSLKEHNLFDINDSEAIIKKRLVPGSPSYFDRKT